MTTKHDTAVVKPNWLSIGAVLAAIGVSAYCAPHFLLLSLAIWFLAEFTHIVFDLQKTTVVALTSATAQASYLSTVKERG